MRTVLDPLALVNSQDERDAAAGEEETQLEEETQRGNVTQRDNETQRREEARPDEERQALFVTLRGDEQLALAVERVEGTIRVPVEALAPSRPPPRPLRATLEHEGTRVFVLAPSQLFDAAMQGTERRRQRQGQ
jgi:chemotaxis signal transduction protein